MKGYSIFLLFVISTLLVSISATNFAYAGNDSSEDDEDRKEKNELRPQPPVKEVEEKQKEKIEKSKQQQKEKIEDFKQQQKELREEYKQKLEEKKRLLADYKEDLKEKYIDLKNEFREKYAQLRISAITDINEDDKIKSEIKLSELRLLKHEFREQLKNLKLESKQKFDELKNQLTDEATDRKNKIKDRLNEIKEKFKNKIKEYKHSVPSDDYPIEYGSKKIEICHIPPGNPDNSQTLSISVNALRAHLAHGDYIDDCEVDETGDTEETQIEVEIEDGVAKIVVKIGPEVEEFEIEETDRALIIQFIADNTDLTIEEIESFIEFEGNEEDEGETIHVELKEELGLSQK